MHIDPTYRLINRADREDLGRGNCRVHYLHIPKCGGTTLRYMLEGFAMLRKLTVVNEARRSKGRIPDLSSGQIVMGHSRGPDTLARDDTCYITVLREPVARLRSFVAMMAKRADRPVDKIAQNLTWKQANSAVYLLSGENTPKADAIGRAKNALENRIHLFGFQESFGELAALVSAMLGIDGVVYPVFQKTPKTQRLDDRYDDMFAEMATADQDLFEFARQLYLERFSQTLDIKMLEKKNPNHKYMFLKINETNDTIDTYEANFS